MDIFNFLFSPDFPGWLTFLKIIYIFFSVLLLFSIIFTLLRTTWFKKLIILDFFEFFTFRPYGAKKIIKQWTKILARLDSGLESEYKLAIIESDSLLDEILKRMGYAGESLGERLKKVVPDILPNVEQVWEAHKIRNNIVHDPDYRLSLDSAKKAIAIYEKAFSDLGVF